MISGRCADTVMLLLIAALSEEVSGILGAARFEPVPGPESFVTYRSMPFDSTGLDSTSLDVAIVLTGTGRERATRATRWAFDAFEPAAMMSIGYGGATLDTLQSGDLVLGTTLYRLDGSPFYWDSQQLGDPLTPDKALFSAARNAVEVAGIDFEQGPIINLPTIAKTAGMKHWIGQEVHGACVDMESFMVCEVANDAGVPFVALRAIVDPIEMDLPDVVGQIDQAPFGGRLCPAIKHLSRHPRDIAALIRLARSAARARRSMTGFFAEFSTQMGATGELALEGRAERGA
jgi:adenosylhomocysteine nucleosidase